MKVSPVFASLTRHRLTAAVMIISTAFTCAIVCICTVVIGQHWSMIQVPSGLDENALSLLEINDIPSLVSRPAESASAAKPGPGLTVPASGGAASENAPFYEGLTQTIRSIPGVTSAVVVSGLPFDYGISTDVASRQGADDGETLNVATMMGGIGERKTLGLTLVAGRDFRPEEYLDANNFKAVDSVSSAIVSKSLAARLFRGKEALGRLIYLADHPVRVIGVVDHLLTGSPGLDPLRNEDALLLPLRPDGGTVTFVIRSSPGDRQALLDKIRKTLIAQNPQLVITATQSFRQLRDQYFKSDTVMIEVLSVASLCLLLVTAAGFFGLVSFWVRQRTRSFGIRRALGARRSDILKWVYMENLVVVLVGVVIGIGVTYAANALMIIYFAGSRVPFTEALASAAMLLVVGQIAVSIPAMRAANIAPIVASRSL